MFLFCKSSKIITFSYLYCVLLQTISTHRRVIFKNLNFTTMKAIQSSIFRAICSIAVGALLIKYPDDTAVWLTMAIGGLFLLSGIISCISYFFVTRRDDTATVFDSDGRVIASNRPTFPVVGVGSVALGLLLVISPAMVINFLSYILGGILILGAINQMLNIIAAGRLGRITPALWISPVLVLIIGIIAIIKPMWIAGAPLVIIGWCLLLYGVTEVVNELKINAHRKKIERYMAKGRKLDADDAVEIKDNAIEIKDDAQ